MVFLSRPVLGIDMYSTTKFKVSRDAYIYYHCKHPWALKHNLGFWPAWAFTRDINYIYLIVCGSCYIDPLKCGT